MDSDQAFEAAIAEMEKCVRCLGLELPGAVHVDVRRIWDNLKQRIATLSQSQGAGMECNMHAIGEYCVALDIDRTIKCTETPCIISRLSAPGSAPVSAPAIQPELIAAAIAHRGCCGVEHDPQNGKLHGYCVVCGVPWPCDTAKQFLAPAPLSAPVAGEVVESPAMTTQRKEVVSACRGFPVEDCLVCCYEKKCDNPKRLSAPKEGG